MVVLGGSFIGLEAAASLRSRGLEVDLVTPEARPMAKLFGGELSDLVLDEHRKRGVKLHLGRRASRSEGKRLFLDDGSTLLSDMIVVGIGVEPRLELLKAPACVSIAA